MNPFNLETKYDEHLAELLAKISKAAVTSTNELLKELLNYLPKSNYKTDYQIILKTVKPLIASPGKQIINKIVFYLAKHVGSGCLDLIAIEWLYENFDYRDVHTQAVIEKFFDFEEWAPKCLKALKWTDYIKDLQFYKFLCSKNTSDTLLFDISKLPLTTYLELDILYDILEILKHRNLIEFLKYKELSKQALGINTSESVTIENQFIFSIFKAVKGIKNTILLGKKYKILMAIFCYVDETIYEESKDLDYKLFSDIDFLDFDRLTVSNSKQLINIISKINKKYEYIIKNISSDMCVFELIKNIPMIKNMIIENSKLFSSIIAKSIEKHYINAMPCCQCNDEYIKMYCEFLFPFTTGKSKIIFASLFNKQLDVTEFSQQDIETVIEHSVNVFPIKYFVSTLEYDADIKEIKIIKKDKSQRHFNTTAVFLFTKYPELLTDMKFKFLDILRYFTKTKPEQMIKIIERIDTLIVYLESLSKETIKKLNKLNTRPLLKIVYLFYLRNEIEQFNVDYAVVFEYFLHSGFIKYLIETKNNIEDAIENCHEYISNLNVENTILNTGFNFDHDPFFYYNISSCFIPNDTALEILYVAMTDTPLSVEMELLYRVMGVILHKSFDISSHLADVLENKELKEKLLEKLKFGKNKKYLDRFLLEFDYLYLSRVPMPIYETVLELNTRKATDVLLRNIKIPKEYLTSLNSSYLSNEALKNVIDNIYECDIIKPLDCNRIRTNVQIDIDQITTDIEQNEIANKICNLKVKETDNEVYVKLIKKYFNETNIKGELDFLYLIEEDQLLLHKDYRKTRLQIYNKLLQDCTGKLADIFVNLYGISKEEKELNKNEMIEMIFSPIKHYKSIFWLLLSNTILKIKNIYLIFFIEEMLSKYLVDNSTALFKDILPLQEYFTVCTESELASFGMAFPNIYSRYNIKSKLQLEDYVSSLTNIKVENGKICFSKTPDAYKLKLNYLVDSITFTATITIPVNYPRTRAKIDFEKDSKNAKFYHKLNELLSKTSKFIEIFFIWKIDIDNRLLGHTECLICYFIMDPKTRKLPDFTCKTCKNVFHSKCIYKWAKESKNSRCAFCRSELQLWD